MTPYCNFHLQTFLKVIKSGKNVFWSHASIIFNHSKLSIFIPQRHQIVDEKERSLETLLNNDEKPFRVTL